MRKIHWTLTYGDMSTSICRPNSLSNSLLLTYELSEITCKKCLHILSSSNLSFVNELLLLRLHFHIKN